MEDSTCIAISLTQFCSFLLFSLLCNAVLIMRVTTLVPERFQLMFRLFLGLLYLTCLSLIIIATAINFHTTLCKTRSDQQLNGAGKLGLCAAYFMLLLCFVIPLRQMIRYAEVVQDSSKKMLKRVSFLVIVQVSIPIFVYFLCAILRTLDLWGTYRPIGFILEDITIFLAMSMTYNMNGSSKRSQASRSKAYSVHNSMQQHSWPADVVTSYSTTKLASVNGREGDVMSSSNSR